MELMMTRRRLLIGKKSRLPVEYQEVEYLQANGAQYINTELYITNSQSIYAKVDFEMLPDANGDNLILGACQRASNSYLDYKIPNWYNTKIEIRGYGISNNDVVRLPKEQRAVFTFDYKNNSQVIKLNEETIVTAANSMNTGPDVPLIVFARKEQSTLKWYARAKCYSIVIALDGNSSLNFVPCYRKVDSKPGMYDIVRRTFFTNNGSGEFTVGPDVN